MIQSFYSAALAALGALGARPVVERAAAWLTGQFTTWPADDFSRFTRTARPGPEAQSAALPPQAPPVRIPEPIAIAPGTFELRFVDLHRNQHFESMWDLIAEDAQRAWGGRPRFVERMQQQAAEFQLLEAAVDGTEIIPEWIDQRRNRRYLNVARLEMRYRVRDGWRELAMRRQVHLVPAAGGWRTLYYPAETAVW